MDLDVIGYIIVPLLIFFIRIADVSLGTLRIIFVSRGIKATASALGFFEVLIWLVAIGQIMRNLNSPLHYIAYAAGFGMGNYVGISIENFIQIGNRAVRIVTASDADKLAQALRSEGYGVTSVAGRGAEGPVNVLFTVTRRANIRHLLEVVKRYNPHAFYTVEDIGFVKETSLFPIRDKRLEPLGKAFLKRK
ncbi:MAG: DUF2179 domain-containing protein [Candidatus Omnitrophica bacterium]|nr:DUF2179 domain-containing protein [Candidatus Omnitrophota bacterium]